VTSGEDGWPDAIEEVKVHDTRQAVVKDIADNVTHTQPDPTPFDEEDLRYLSILELLQMLKEGRSAVLSLSDKVTSHVVNAIGFFVRDRSYRIIYADPLGSQSTFLQEGRNVAGVSAEHYGEHAWSVSHHELVCVLDSAFTLRPKMESDSGKEA